MKIPFWKMQGCGNDFIVIDNRPLNFSQEQLQQLALKVCQRRVSLGGDALMVVDQPKETSGGDLRMRFFNADGTEAEMCGNGARCFARYAFDHGFSGEILQIETMAGLVSAKPLAKNRYQVQLNSPTLFQKALPFEEILTPQESQQVLFVDLIELGKPGIPHLVVHFPKLAEIDEEQLRSIAKKLRHWQLLPKGANVNFFQLQPSTDTILAKTFERGVEDFTLACGTGSGSVAYSLVQRGLVAETEVNLQVPGGKLTVKVKGKELDLQGEALVVAEGELVLAE